MNNKSFLIGLFLLILNLSNTVFAESVTITNINPLPTTVYQDTTVYGSYLLQAFFGQTIVFKNQLSPWIELIPGAPGNEICYNGIVLPSSGQCIINLKLSPPAITGHIDPIIKAGIDGVPTSFTQYITTIQTNTNPTLVSIAVTPNASSVYQGITAQFIAIGTYTDGTSLNITNSVTWTSNAPAIATIIPTTGLATGVSHGESTITATFGSVSGAAILTVTRAELLSIEITPLTSSIYQGLTQQLIATGIYTGGKSLDITNSVDWTSSTPGIATIISNTGLATGVSHGESTITATFGSVSGTASLTVTPALLTSITITPATSSIYQGLTQQLIATGIYADGTSLNITNSVDWTSGTPGIATIISNTGLATGVSTGESTITATFGSVSGTAALTVTPAALTSIAVTPANSNIYQGLTKQFTATGKYTDGTYLNITNSVAWTSSTPRIATITPATGLATGVSTGGPITITARFGSAIGTATLTVDKPTLRSIAVTPATSSIHLGLTQQFTATGTYTDDTNKDITNSVLWTSNKPATASIDINTGLATGLLVSEPYTSTTITATFGAISGTAALTVTEAGLLSIAVTPATSSIYQGLTQQFTAIGSYTDSTTQDITNSVAWTSNAPATASIDINTGLATGVLVSEPDTSVTITATFGSVSDTAALIVNAAKLLSIEVTPANQTINKGLTQQFTATGRYTGGTTLDITTSVAWTSNAPAIAPINLHTGLANGVSTGGPVTITATFGAVSGATSLIVNPAALVSITVTPTTSSMPKGLMSQFTATGQYTDGTTPNITNLVEWNSSDTDVATIDNGVNNGRVHALKTGTTNITASLIGITSPNQVVLTVTIAELVSIQVTPSNPYQNKGLTIQFTAIGTYTDQSTPDITNSVIWNSSATNIATINNGVNKGLALAIKVGITSITASLSSITSIPSQTLTVAP